MWELVHFGFYGTHDELRQLTRPLVAVLDGRPQAETEDNSRTIRTRFEYEG